MTPVLSKWLYFKCIWSDKRILHDSIVDIIFAVTFSFLVHKFDFNFFIPFNIYILWNLSVASTTDCSWTTNSKCSAKLQNNFQWDQSNVCLVFRSKLFFRANVKTCKNNTEASTSFFTQNICLCNTCQSLFYRAIPMLRKGLQRQIFLINIFVKRF